MLFQMLLIENPAYDHEHIWYVTECCLLILQNFIETDNEGNGILRRRDIKNALYGFDIPLTPREFEKLWMR